MRSNRNTSSRYASSTRSTPSRQSGFLPTQKLDWQVTTGYSQTGLTGFTADTPLKGGRSERNYNYGYSGKTILASELADYQKLMPGSRPVHKGKAAYDAYNAQKQKAEEYLVGATQRTVDALNSSAIHKTGPVSFIKVKNDYSLDVSPNRGGWGKQTSREPQYNISSYNPNVDQKFTYGQYATQGKVFLGVAGMRDAKGHNTGIYVSSPQRKTEYSSTVPGTPVGEGGWSSRDRRTLAINKDNQVDNSLEATTSAVTPGDILKKRLSNINRRGRVSMPTGGPGGDEPRINISSTGVTGLNFA
jgi:hypothetical protein